MKFYTDLSLLNINNLAQNVYDLGHTFMYVSLLPKELKIQFLSNLNSEAYSTYKSILDIKEQFVTEESDSDYSILPPFSYYNAFEDEIYKYENYINSKTFKKLLFFYPKDDNAVVSFKHLGINLKLNEFIMFRSGGRRTDEDHNVYGLPYIVNDYFKDFYIEKELSISYCGFSSNHIFKEDIINFLNSLEYSNFIIRDTWADCNENITDSFYIGPSKKSKMEFIYNMATNLYGVAIRGMNNNSYRLYELFMMGRIPILFNTDCLLPFENEIPYRKNTVYITDFYNIEEQIERYHNSHTEQELYKIQKENRAIWEKYFSPLGAFYSTKNLLSQLSK